jgi:2-keto-4-pentenoate hydratase/2-oxohepta-3-ene-1,7-dioic acid hydratase in catechol pathway
MKIVSYQSVSGPSFGLVNGTTVVDLGRRLGVNTLRAALEQGLVERFESFSSEPGDYELKDLTLDPVIPNPDKILCVGINYATHMRETGREPPSHPMLFPRFSESQVGHGQAMLRPAESEQLDFEGELAVVIGKAGRRISAESALDHVAGYACYNDGSVRDWQRHTSQFLPGKNFVRTGGFGPWLVTADEIPDPSKLVLQTRLNGQVMQRAPISDLIFDVPALIAYSSTFLTLLPGDVIVTGTTSGVGAYRSPPVWMRAGDTVEVEISGIGILRNLIQDEC